MDYGISSYGICRDPAWGGCSKETLAKLQSKRSRRHCRKAWQPSDDLGAGGFGTESSPAYQKFNQNGVEAISEYDFCEALYCTLESTAETVSKNFEVVRQHVTAYGRNDLVEFLEVLKTKFASKFLGRRSRGGLMPQKKEP